MEIYKKGNGMMWRELLIVLIFTIKYLKNI